MAPIAALFLITAATVLGAIAAPAPTLSTGTCVIQPSNGALVVTPSWTTSLCIDLYDGNYKFLAQVKATAGAGTFNVAQYASAGGNGASYYVEGYSTATCTGKSFIAYYQCVAAPASGATPAPTTTAPTTTAAPTPTSACTIAANGDLLVTPSWTTSKCIDLYNTNYTYLAQVVASTSGTGLFAAANYITAGARYYVEGYSASNCKGSSFISYYECTTAAAPTTAQPTATPTTTAAPTTATPTTAAPTATPTPTTATPTTETPTTETPTTASPTTETPTTPAPTTATPTTPAPTTETPTTPAPTTATPTTDVPTTPAPTSVGCPCQNGGTCSSSGGGTYTCACPSEYFGTNCESQVCQYYNPQGTALKGPGLIFWDLEIYCSQGCYNYATTSLDGNPLNTCGAYSFRGVFGVPASY